MKRPLAAFGFMYLAAQIIAVFGGQVVSFTLFFVLSAALILYLALVRRRSALALTLIISALLSVGLHSVYLVTRVRPVWTLEGREAAVTARVTEQPRGSGGRYYCFVETHAVYSKDSPQRVTLKLSSKQPIEAEVDDMIECRVKFARSETARSSVLSARARGAAAVAYIDPSCRVSVHPGDATLYGRIVRLRMALTARINHIYGSDRAPLLTGLLLGNTSYMDERTLRMFRVCGLSHYLAVSGMHLSVLYFALERLLTACRVPLRLRSAFIAVFTVFFMALTGFSSSVTRAGVMLVINCAARAVMRESDGINSLGAAALIICLLRPFAAADAGFLMSVCCSLGLMTLAPALRRRALSAADGLSPKRAKAVSALCGAVIAPFTASLSAFPVAALYFGEVSLISVPCNIICFYPAFGFFLLGAASVALSFVPVIGEALSIPFFFPARLCASVLLAAVRTLSSPSWAAVDVDYRCLPALIALCAAVLAAAYFMFRNDNPSKRKYAARLCAVLLMVAGAAGISAERAYAHHGEEIRVFGVGDGIACCARCGSKCMLFGAGGDRSGARSICDGISGMRLPSLDYMVLPEDSAEYMFNAAETAEALRPERIWMPENSTYTDLVGTRCDGCNCHRMSIHGNQKWYSVREKLGFETYTDSDGSTWYRLFSGELTALIVPEGGRVSALPEHMRSPDAAILLSDDITDPSLLGAKLFVVCADEDRAERCVSTLRLRGISAVCSPEDNGTLRITVHKDGVKLEEVSSDARY